MAIDQGMDRKAAPGRGPGKRSNQRYRVGTIAGLSRLDCTQQSALHATFRGTRLLTRVRPGGIAAPDAAGIQLQPPFPSAKRPDSFINVRTSAKLMRRCPCAQSLRFKATRNTSLSMCRNDSKRLRTERNSRIIAYQTLLWLRVPTASLQNTCDSMKDSKRWLHFHCCCPLQNGRSTAAIDELTVR